MDRENISETAINTETNSDDFNPIQPHNGKKIDQIIVSRDTSYALTYSREDNSVRGWLVNVEENGQQQPDVYFKLDKSYKIDIDSFILYKKILLFCHNYLGPSLIDLSGDGGRFLQLKHAERMSIRKNSMGFLPNGDLILVSLNNESRDYKIYLFSFINKPTNATLWDYSQIYDIEIHESLNKNFIDCFVYQTKLFLLNNGLITQWDLLKMTTEMQYNLVSYVPVQNLVINQNQTLLALNQYGDEQIDVYSMETGIHVSRYGLEGYHNSYNPVEFVILKDGSEGLLIFNEDNRKYKFLDPFHPSDAINITSDITDIITNDFFDNDLIINNITGNEHIENIIITKSNKKFYIKENNVWVTDGLKENTFQKMLNTTYHSNIYNLSTFKTIRNMLDDVIRNNITDCVIREDDKIKLTDSELFHFILSGTIYSSSSIKVKGLKKSQNNENNNDWKQIRTKYILGILSYKQLNNQDLALITKEGIFIYTIVENSLILQYFWNNEKWKNNENNDDFDFNTILQEILDNEFKDSLPSPNFMELIGDRYDEKIIKNIMNDPIEFSKFGSKMLEIAIEIKKDDIIQSIFDKIIKLVEKDHRYMALLSIISIKLPELCDQHSSLVMKYILRTSILLDPFCSSVKNSTNTSLYAYSKDIYIKKSTSSSINYIKSLFSSFHKMFLKISSLFSKKTPTISFIVPFPQICKYQKNDYNFWNRFLYMPKSIIFCSVDSKNFYKWWNFAAIVDFKWKTFEKCYHILIWSFHTIFFLCFALASTLETLHSIADSYKRILFIITILLGFIHLSFEVQYCLWKWKVYFKDPWNLFEIVAYSLPIFTSIHWLIHGNPSIWITAISNLLLNLKFLLFFQAFQSFEKCFIIITDVINKIFHPRPFGMLLSFIMILFACAFFILSNSSMKNSLLKQLKQSPFVDHATGNLSWTYQDAYEIILYLVLFMVFTVIYLINLFIEWWLNTKFEIFLIQRTKIIMKIELFYMLPYQRHSKKKFPDWIYYDMPVEEVCKLIDTIDNKKAEFNSPPFISKKLRELVGIPEPIELQQQIDEQTKGELIIQVNNELKQQLVKPHKKFYPNNSVISP